MHLARLASAGILALLLLLLAAPPPGHGEEDGLRLGRLSSFGGTIRLARGERDRFLVVVARKLRGPFHEILAEEEFGHGQFRVRFAGPDGGMAGVLLSPRHVPIVRQLVSGHTWERRAFNPRVWETAQVQFVDDDFRPLAGATVRSISASWNFAFHVPPTLLLFEQRADASGSVPLRMSDRLLEFARAETSTLLTPYLPIVRHSQRGMLPVRCGTGRKVTVVTWREREGRGQFEMLANELKVSARTPDGWKTAKGAGRLVEWTGRLPHGTDAVKVEAEGMRPWLRLGLDPRDTSDLDLFAVLREGPHRPRSRLTVRTEARDLVELPQPDHAFGCGGCVAPLRRFGPSFRAGIRPAGEGEFAAMAKEPPDFPKSMTREPGKPEPAIPDLGCEVLLSEPGRYEVRVRADLGFPRTRTVDVPEDADVEIAVDVSNVGGIRIVAAESKRQAFATVSFRLEGADGEPVAAEYGDGMFNRPPYYSCPGPVYENIPNRGILRVDPGVYRVVFLEEDEDGDKYTVRVRPDTVRRLDTRFVEPDEDPRRRRVR